MAEESESFNYEVADIYQSMLNGDKSALYKLQQINVMAQLPRFQAHSHHKYHKVNTEQNTHPEEQHAKAPEEGTRAEAEIKASSVVNISSKKEQMYLNVIRRGAKMGALSKNQGPPHHAPKRITSSQQQPEIEPQEKKLKPKFSQEDNPQRDLSAELKTHHTADLQLPKQSKIYALPKLPKPKEGVKIQSAQPAGSKKNTSLYQPEKVKMPKKGQKVDFKELIGKSKQERYEFDKKNEEERKAQLQLVEYHRSTKDFLERVKEKHHLNLSNKRKFLKRNKTEEHSHFHSVDISQTNNTEKLSPFKARLELEKNKCLEFTEDINHLKIQYSKNLAALNKLEKSIASLPFQQYYQNRNNSVESISEEEEDQVEPLETAEEIKKKYRHLMAHTRDRKWGLLQRTEYEAQRTQSLGQSRRTGDSRVRQGQQLREVGEQNKMVINQRLKDLLFT